ncbi:hypothetical protein DYE50_03555 [Treponema ruminis]|nr:hypothetical protein DYE50_03555 [Treponema ruminis]
MVKSIFFEIKINIFYLTKKILHAITELSNDNEVAGRQFLRPFSFYTGIKKTAKAPHLKTGVQRSESAAPFKF